MNYKIITAIGLAGSTLAALFGGWDKFLQTLLLFMAVDWFTGGILLPAVFGKSPKSEKGTLESRAGWKGLCRKAMTLFYVLIAARLDALMGTDYLRDRHPGISSSITQIIIMPARMPEPTQRPSMTGALTACPPMCTWMTRRHTRRCPFSGEPGM